MRHGLSLLSAFALAAVLCVTASVVLAWTGPTQAPPNGNVAAPINVGSLDQTKSGGIGVNALAVFGNAIISTVSGYLNFGATVGTTGYGFRDNSGTMEFRNNGGVWRPFIGSSNGAVGPVTQIIYSDGTTQTTAGGGSGGISSVTTATCTGWECTVSCPAGYFRTGCNATGSAPQAFYPTGSNSCQCYPQGGENLGNGTTCYAICAR